MRERDEWQRHRDADLALPAAMERFADRVAAPLRAPERADPTFASRVMAAVRADAPHRAAASEPWYGRRVRVSPLAGLAAAAALAGVAYLGGRAAGRADATTAPAAAAAAPSSDTVRVVQFVFVAPGARRVTLVGDFNGWDREATRLTPGGARGLWTVAVALPAGRHEYAFVVDGTRWAADPATAASAVADDFGVVTSVISVDAPSRPHAS